MERNGSVCTDDVIVVAAGMVDDGCITGSTAAVVAAVIALGSSHCDLCNGLWVIPFVLLLVGIVVAVVIRVSFGFFVTESSILFCGVLLCCILVESILMISCRCCSAACPILAIWDHSPLERLSGTSVEEDGDVVRLVVVVVVVLDPVLRVHVEGRVGLSRMGGIW